jgi:hypothetical protein
MVSSLTRNQVRQHKRRSAAAKDQSGNSAATLGLYTISVLLSSE